MLPNKPLKFIFDLEKVKAHSSPKGTLLVIDKPKWTKAKENMLQK